MSFKSLVGGTERIRVSAGIGDARASGNRILRRHIQQINRVPAAGVRRPGELLLQRRRSLWQKTFRTGCVENP